MMQVGFHRILFQIAITPGFENYLLVFMKQLFDYAQRVSIRFHFAFLLCINQTV